MKILDVNSLTIKIAKENKLVDSSFTISSGDVILLTGPNGCGKSTIIKIIMGDVFEYSKLNYKGSNILYYQDNNEYSILGSEKNMEYFRKNVCYISQDDIFESNSLLDCFRSSLLYQDIDAVDLYIFEFVKKYKAYESFYFDKASNHLSYKEKKFLNSIGIDAKKATSEDIQAVKLISMNVKRMSGGQRKLANILSNLAKAEYSKLIILDEPLNNLDYNNVRAFSNILTRIYQSNPELGILIVTHCKSIPIINKVIEIDVNEKRLVAGSEYSCNSCFGKLSANCLYE